MKTPRHEAKFLSLSRRQKESAVRLEARVERFLSRPDVKKALAEKEANWPSGLPGTAETLRRYLAAIKGQSPLPRNLDTPLDERGEVRDRITHLMRSIEHKIDPARCDKLADRRMRR